MMGLTFLTSPSSSSSAPPALQLLRPLPHFLLLLLLPAWDARTCANPAGTSGHTCPSYASIRQPSVAGSALNIHDISGLWYLQATTEPTTRFCRCNLMNFSVGASTYRYTDTCFEDMASPSTWRNVTVHIGGKLSTDADWPGQLMEGFELKNKTVLPKPTFLFNVTRSAATGELLVLRFYACLGKVLPFAAPLFSYLLYTRRIDVPEEAVRSMVAEDAALARGALDLDGIVYTNTTAWRTCGYTVG
eukprot:m.14340 g.14340  ORF g.14340 m.14340 type:complete len:246 (+) comp4780_c0_seq1:107-844(+)